MNQKIIYKKGDIVEVSEGFNVNLSVGLSSKYLLILNDGYPSPYSGDNNSGTGYYDKAYIGTFWYSTYDIQSCRFFKRLHESYIKGLITS